MDHIVWCLWRESLSAISYDNLDGLVLQLLGVWLAQILIRKVGKWLDMLDPNDGAMPRRRLLRSHHLVKCGTKNPGSWADVKNFGARLQSVAGQFKYIRVQFGRRNDDIEVDGPRLIYVSILVNKAKIALVILHVLLIVTWVILPRAPKLTSIHLKHNLSNSFRSYELALYKRVDQILFQLVFHLLQFLFLLRVYRVHFWFMMEKNYRKSLS